MKTQRSILWRADIERWRWLLLGSLGVVAGSCGGKTGADGDDPERASVAGQGGAPAATGGQGGTNFGYGGSNASGGAGATDGLPHSFPPPTTAKPCELPSTALGGNWASCANGLIHRGVVGTCPSLLPRVRSDLLAPDAGSDAGLGGDPRACQQDSDCTESAHGHCETASGALSSYCVYGCVRDSECDPGFACLCGSLIGSCVPAQCKVDADCGSLLCANYTDSPGCGGIAFQCQSLNDQCASDAECSSGQPYCTLLGPPEDQSRVCSPPRCVIGRPFLIDGEERSAGCVERNDWYRAGVQREPAPGGLEPELRRSLCAGWSAQALMEHASVAAFARFALQLASLGAPAELLSRTATAMSDEIRHARACFELARRYSDRDLGPGLLPVEGALQGSDLAAIVASTILEGCIGETLAAVEAAEALSHCEDPVVAAVLESIVTEETQHAELAWQFVAWALGAGPERVREQAAALFQAELARPAPAVLTANENDRALLRHGLLSSRLRPELRARVLRGVIAPCAAALLAPRATEPRAPAPSVA